MEEWKEYKIGDIAKTNTSQYSLLENWETIQYLDTGSITKNQISGIEKFLGNTDLPSRARRKVKHGDIVYSCVRPNLCHYGYIDDPPANLLVSTGFVVITVDPNLADARFIYYFLTQDNIVQSLHTIGEQAVSTYPSIKASDIEDLSISLPPLPIQHKIASILKSLDDKIEVNKRINENLEQQAQALFKSWFVDFEPFRDGEFVESELGMIPKGWKVGQIYEYIDVIYGAPYKSSLFNEEKNGLPLIRIRDLKTFSPQFFTPEILPTTEYIEAGDVVAGMDAEFIPCIWIGEKGVLNQRCCKFKPKRQGVCNYYILFLLKPELEFVQGYKTGTTVSHLGKSDIDRFKVVIPPIEIVSSFSSKADVLLKQKVVIANESRRLAELRDTLLPRLMSGELKVSDVTL